MLSQIGIIHLFCCPYVTTRCNFSLAARYLLKFTRCSLLSKITRYSLQNSLVTRCKICSLLVAKVESIFATFLKSDSGTGVFTVNFCEIFQNIYILQTSANDCFCINFFIIFLFNVNQLFTLTELFLNCLIKLH